MKLVVLYTRRLYVIKNVIIIYIYIDIYLCRCICHIQHEKRMRRWVCQCFSRGSETMAAGMDAGATVLPMAVGLASKAFRWELPVPAVSSMPSMIVSVQLFDRSRISFLKTLPAVFSADRPTVCRAAKIMCGHPEVRQVLAWSLFRNALIVAC